jgi:hypothetical protein
LIIGWRDFTLLSMSPKNVTGEIRTVDEWGMLVRIIEYTVSGAAHDGKFYYHTEEGEACSRLENGDFVELSTARILSLIR